MIEILTQYWYIIALAAATAAAVIFILKRSRKRPQEEPHPDAMQQDYVADLERQNKELRDQLAAKPAPTATPEGDEEDFDKAVTKAFIRSVGKSTFAIKGTLGMKRKVKIGKEDAELELQGTMQPTLEESVAKAEEPPTTTEEV